jgi:hypothetical protein
MKLIRDRWMPMFALARQLEPRVRHLEPETFSDVVEQGMKADYRAAEALMAMSETIVLPSQIMLDMVHNIDRIDTRGWIRLPYPYVIIQFTHSILETDLMAHEEKNDLMTTFGLEDDLVEGIVIGNADQDKRPFPPQHVFNMMNCCILFRSTSVNRVAWLGTDKPAHPHWQNSTFQEANLPPNARENKYRMIALCYAINLFLNAPNVIVVKEKPDPQINAKRERKGKAILPEYHTVTIQKVQVKYAEPSGKTGTAHTRMYPVRGHFRKLAQFEDPIWVHNHFRGLKHGEESLVKEIYRVAPKK